MESLIRRREKTVNKPLKWKAPRKGVARAAWLALLAVLFGGRLAGEDSVLGRFRGDVRIKDGGALQGADVLLWSSAELKIVGREESDENGHYQFFNVAIGEYEIQACHQGYCESQTEMEMRLGEQIKVVPTFHLLAKDAIEIERSQLEVLMLRARQPREIEERKNALLQCETGQQTCSFHARNP